MAIQFHPKIGTLLLCDFDVGALDPEMRKRRPAVVVSPPISLRSCLCTVVPLSTTAPSIPMPYHVALSLTLPPPFDAPSCWAKCDMAFPASFKRLDLFRDGRGEDGRRRYLNLSVTMAELARIRAGILASLGLANLTKHLDSAI